jgi:hypothetical protein
MIDRAAIAGGGFGGIGLDGADHRAGAAVLRWQVPVSSGAATPGRDALLSEL